METLKKVLGWLIIANVCQLLFFNVLFSIEGGDWLKSYCVSWAAIILTAMGCGAIYLGIVLIDE